jgi:hypothetical protein
MRQLVTRVYGAGYHNFYPTCPLQGLHVLHVMMKKDFDSSVAMKTDKAFYVRL